MFFASSFLFADPVGIDKVRLFEAAESQYVLEVDTIPQFVAAYRDPVLPGRFELTDSQRERQSGYLVLRYRFRSLAEPLGGDDELLLPWERSGASITAQWSDGSVMQNLFLRDFEGIRVPIRNLKRSHESVAERALRCLDLGLEHGSLEWSHGLLIAAVGFLARGWWRIGLILCLAAGQAISLVLADLGVLVISIEAAEICVVVVALLVARAAPLERDQCHRFVPVMLVLGLLHGAASAKMLLQADVREADLVQALFMFNLGIDLFQLVAVTVLGAFAAVVELVFRSARESLGRNFRGAKGDYGVRAGVGGAAFGLLLIAVSGGRITGDSQVVPQQSANQFELPAAQIVSAGMGSRPQPARVLREPVASFLTIEPFETRLEVLIRLAHASEWVDLPAGQTTIEIDQQERVKEQLIDLIAQRTVMQFDGNKAAPIVQRADFVTVEPNGIYSRPADVPEPLDDAVVGIAFIYDTAEMADEVKFEWTLFSSKIQSVPATLTDPFGGRKRELTLDDSTLIWKNRWSGYRPPEIEPVVVSKPTLPLLSVLLAAVAGGCYWRRGRGERRRSSATIVILLVTAAFVTYPFVRVAVGAPFTAMWQPSAEEAAEVVDRLLTNVYRAYDMRDEEAIYDRLALTITGEELTETYLDTRRSLELENRGGARAKVDEVEILDLHSVSQGDAGGFAIDLTWTVSGSVTHFGHTHYRRNRYRAVVTIVPTDGHWKVQSIHVGEQQRML